ncbi:kinase-like domain-containing protein [Rhizophagus irregularis DAOM 181602=DAOM 197198]|nr:kinase-like domain-containing protein [Rhizophagus irregularis DAOM 181602=DAOM 197198]
MAISVLIMKLQKKKMSRRHLIKMKKEGVHVALKSLKNSSNIDPETSKYMMNGGNLRSNLLIKKYNPLEELLSSSAAL